MIDIKWIRENPEKFDNAMEARKLSIRASELIILDEQKRKKIFLIQELQAKRNKLAQDIAIVKKNNGDASLFLQESKNINALLNDAEKNLEDEEILNEKLLNIPNIPYHEVPLGEDENDNIEIEKFSFSNY